MNTARVYVTALLQNPEWLKSVAAKKNAVQTTEQGQVVCNLSAQEIVEAIYELETAFVVEERKRN